jgi:hypothetical protein
MGWIEPTSDVAGVVVRAVSASEVGRWTWAAENAGGAGRAVESSCRKLGNPFQALELVRRTCRKWWSGAGGALPNMRRGSAGARVRAPNMPSVVVG